MPNLVSIHWNRWLHNYIMGVLWHIFPATCQGCTCCKAQCCEAHIPGKSIILQHKSSSCIFPVGADSQCWLSEGLITAEALRWQYLASPPTTGNKPLADYSHANHTIHVIYLRFWNVFMTILRGLTKLEIVSSSAQLREWDAGWKEMKQVHKRNMKLGWPQWQRIEKSLFFLFQERKIHQAGYVERMKGRRQPPFGIHCSPVTCLSLLQNHQRER